jgi:hypothetical protein
MKSLLTAFSIFTLAITFATTTFAQTVTTTGTASVGVNETSPWLTSAPTASSYEFISKTGSKMSPLAADLGITYFDPTLGTHAWGTPFQFTLSNGASALFDGMAEWIHIPNSSGQAYLDSVLITFTAISVAQGGDTIYVYIAPDQEVPITGLGTFHLMDVSGQSAPLFAQAPLFVAASSAQGGTVKINFPHVPVDPDFHVAVFPHLGINSNNQLVALSTFALQGDTEKVRTRLTDNSHSNFYYLNLSAGGAGEGVIDSFFQFGGGKPLYSNFNIKAYVTAPQNGVTERQSSGSIGLYPNPVTNALQVNGLSQSSTYQIFDIMGRSIQHGAVQPAEHINVANLTPGQYTITVSSADHTEAHAFLVTR